MTKTKARDDPGQSVEFVKVAKELGFDEPQFEKVFGVVAKHRKDDGQHPKLTKPPNTGKMVRGRK